MSGYEIDKNTDKAVLATFSIEIKPAQFSLASLPEEVLHWIEKQGFDFITVLNDIGDVVYISNSIKKILGFESDDLIERNVISYFSPSDQKKIPKNFMKNTNEVQQFTASIRDTFGRYKGIDSVIASIFSRDTNEKLYISLSKDITDKKEAEQILIRSEKMSIAGQLAAGIAHEIRNPLTSLKGFVQLLQAGINRKDEYYKIMIDEIEKIDTISSELLFIAKPMTDERKNENVASMIQDVIMLLHAQAKVYNIKLDSEVEIDLTVYCDRTQIKQVLINLIKNAIEEMPDGGVIKIKVTDDHSYCIISIIDEGPGIPESLVHKLKEPFFTTKKDGTGLGLMISNKIIENHNGKLNILQNQNKGSTFSILLPRINENI